MKTKAFDTAIFIFVFTAGFFLLLAISDRRHIFDNTEPTFIFGPSLIMQEIRKPTGPVTKPKPLSIRVAITQKSPEVFSYAHGTVMVRDKIYVGMAARNGNPFPTNQIFVFSDLSNLNDMRVVSLPTTGDIGSMVYDDLNDQIYFMVSNIGGLQIFRMNPRTFQVSTVISTTSIDVGMKPAITTDGKYIYGITYTDPSTIFKVNVNGAPQLLTSTGHIMNGHSAVAYRYGSSTELYVAGGEADLFEKVKADDLTSISKRYFPGCSITDDMPYQNIDSKGGYVYLGCERIPYGYRVKTDDLTFTRFSLPGSSFGMFIYGSDLYNAAHDGNYDIFKAMDISKPKRYYVGEDTQLNELFVSTTTNSLYFTGWWGVKGLYGVASSSGTTL